MATFRLGIGLKLGIVSGVLILLSAGVIVSREIALSRIESAAAEARRQAEVQAEAQEVGVVLGRIRQNATEIRLSFANLENGELARQVSADTQAAQGRLDHLLNLVTSEDDKKTFQNLKGRVAEIGTAIADINTSQDAQLSAVDNRPSIVMRARTTLSELATQLTGMQQDDAARDVRAMEGLFDSINLASYIFMMEDDRKQVVLINTMADRTLKALTAIQESTGGDAKVAQLVGNSRKAIEAYVASIRAGLQEVQKRAKIVSDTIVPAMADATKLLDQITQATVEQTAAANRQSDEALKQGMFVILAFSVIAIAAAIGFGAYAVFGIARPVRRMSDAMEGVSSGDLSTEIPYGRRKDEIGDQARALTFFRDSLVDAERMREARQAEERLIAENRKVEMNDLADQFEAAVGAVVDMVASAATELRAAAETLAATAEETTTQAATVASAANLATTNVQSVAAAIEELSASAREIGDRLQHSTTMTGRAVTEVDGTNAHMTELRTSADQIGTIISMIDTIAGQTNLLALNATIESARAGEAGRGFAVVAQEVKELAGQTAKATADISQRISGIQDSTGDVLGSITGFSRTIGELSASATAIAAAMEEQNATTSEVARSIQQAANGTNEVTSNIVSVERAAQASSAAASQVLSSATDLSRQAESLRSQVRNFVETVRAA